MLSRLNDQDLVLGIKSLVGEEKKILQNILEHLAEIDSRRLYSLRGYPSLFEFCVKELGYSEGSAQRRISAMRLMKTLPEARDKLSDGKVNLSTLSQLQSFIRKEEAQKNTKLNHDQKLELLSAIEDKSQKDCEKELVKINPTAVRRESIRPVTEEFTEIRFTVSKGLDLKLKNLQNLLSHKTKTQSMAELVEILADLALNKLEKDKPQEAKSLSPVKTAKESTAAAAVKRSPQSLSGIKRMVYKRDQGECQYVDPLTKRKCRSRYKIQFDHIHPRGLGGGDTLDNLQLLCQNHNLLRATQAYSQEHMEKYLSRY